MGCGGEGGGGGSDGPLWMKGSSLGGGDGEFGNHGVCSRWIKWSNVDGRLSRDGGWRCGLSVLRWMWNRRLNRSNIVGEV